MRMRGFWVTWSPDSPGSDAMKTRTEPGNPEAEKYLEILTDNYKRLPRGNPGSEYHTLVFPEVHVNYNELVVKLCELFSKITRRDGDLNVLLLDFKHTVLLLIRLLKIKCYEDSLNLPDALDIVLYANILSELVDLFVERGSEFDEYAWEIAVSLAEQYINDDLETAIRVCSGILVKADKLPLQIQKHISSLIDLIFRKCIRDRACRCRHFYPKI